MGTLEKSARRERRLGNFQKALLVTAVLGGVVLIAATAPNAAQLLRFFPGYKKGAKFNYQYKSALGRLAARGYVVFEKQDGKRYARITEKGKRMLQLEIEKTAMAKKKKWDRRWRVIIFDIPERRRKMRVRLRSVMEECGFVRLQDSVWIYPYDCEDLIALAKTNLHLGGDVLYMIVERLERDKHLREHFGLPLVD
ncbi:MAG: CRISPR-associated endonuclease Cas2 [Minisyncoccia bacterium]